MTNRLTTEQLEAIRKRAEKAQGNWLTDFDSLANAIKVVEDIPALLAEVERMNGVVGALMSKLELIEERTEGQANKLAKGAIKYADEEIR